MDHPLDMHCVLKVENHSKGPLNIRRIFSNAGEIPRLYPHETGVPGQFHYFVQYRHRDFADRALRLGLGSSAGLRAYPIHSDLTLVEQYRSCKPCGLLRQPIKGEATETPSLAPTNYPYSLEHEAKGKRKDPLEGRSSDLAATGHPRSMLDNQHSYRVSSLRPNSVPYSRQPSTPHICRTTSDPSKGIHKQAPPDTSAASFSMDSRLVMDIQGQQIVYDLAKDPGQDPKMVIELLKLSSSERGNWMVAGAHFRRIGKPRAAIEVMYAMLEALVNNGFAEAKLKPVFLLLSGCELDLAICTRNSGDLAASQQHYDNVRVWLQKVYGTPLPTTSDQPLSSLLSSAASRNQAPPEPPRPTRTMEVDLRPPSTTSRSINSRKRKMERYSSDERNVRRCSSGPPRMARRSNAKGRYSVNRQHWRHT